MRKFAVVVLVSALAIMLAVCSSTDSSGPTVTPVPTSTPEPTPTATPVPTTTPEQTPKDNQYKYTQQQKHKKLIQ